ncbi:thymidine kinase [Alicyclobacillaceae bacterium I2511]|nr:thymidine kinase [Alicyclobacillaceae bacterium I2511]
MAKLYFRYGQMNASKSIQLLTVAHNYEEQGKRVNVYTPGIANREGLGQVASRVGIARSAFPIGVDTDLFASVRENLPHCVLVDEAQFLSRRHVEQLAQIVDELHVPVIAYGLLKDYRNQFFEGSEALVLWADQIEEIKTVCVQENCNRKATMILKVKEGHPVYVGEQIEIGGNELYRSVCRYHYLHPDGSVLIETQGKSMVPRGKSRN